MTAPFATSPLDHRAPLAAGDAAWLREMPFLGLMSLRGAIDRIGNAAAHVLGTDLPLVAGTTATTESVSVLWIGPDEWIIVTAPGGEMPVKTGLDAALAGIHHQLTDISDYYTAIDVGGEMAWQLLSKLITLDLHPRAFTPGTAAATNAAKANVWLWLRESGDGPAFRVFTRRSHADYLWCLLADAGREWGLPRQDPHGWDDIPAGDVAGHASW